MRCICKLINSKSEIVFSGHEITMRQLIKAWVLFIGLMLLVASTVAQPTYTNIRDYKTTFGTATRDGRQWITLRKFANGNKYYFLLVDPATLRTKVDEDTRYHFDSMNWIDIRDQFKNTPYMRAIAKAEEASSSLQDAGIETGMPEQTGISLTADLCPSHRPLDRTVFTELFKAFRDVEKPVPVALSVTGVWMRQHPADLEWLKKLEMSKQIDITWINHSYNHHVSPTAPLRNNFLLEPGTDINYEVLETEKAMLKNGLLPSVFFRFPGLVSDKQLVTKITAFGLIPIGSDAWLAKGQKTHPGSIVLIHANGNEPVGVKDFIRLLHQNAVAITKKQWLLYDLTESVSDEFKNGD